jgi:arylsulfatase A-like enzyme
LGNHGRDWQVGERLTESAIKFLDDRDQGRPFFMFLGYHEPHTPILAYPGHIARFREKAAQRPLAANDVVRERDGQTRVVQNDAAYGSEVAGLDEFVGRVFGKLEQTGLAKDTIIVFFSDNGGLSTKADPGPTSNRPLRAGKGWLYEGGIRVPLIVRAPGITKAGTVESAAVISTDFYPTLLELAGLPLRPNQHVDGVSVAGLLHGGPAPAPRTLYWHYPHYHGSTWAPGGALRDGDWKLIEFFDEGSAELYNLGSDLAERENLATRESEKLRSLREKLAAWRAATGAVVPALAAANTVEPPKDLRNPKRKRGESR